MAGDSKKLQPIIIKRVKRRGHAHHGGVWKIAYADFVTAMMAFFLLMWLLGSTTKGDLKGISDYFNTPLKVALLGGSGSGDSSSILQGGGKDFTRTVGQVREGEVEARRRTINLQALKAEQARQDAASMERLLQRIEQHVTTSPQLADYRSQIQMDITPDGLRIQIVDDQNRPMFDRGSARVLPHMRDLLRGIGGVLAAEPSSITLAGHTDAAPYAMGDRGYSNWELSADRANASRRELVSGGLPGDRVVRVLGLASSALFDPEQPLAAVNRRISIIVMNRDAEDRFQRGGDVHWQDEPDPTLAPDAPAALRSPAPVDVPVASDPQEAVASVAAQPVASAPAQRAQPGPVLVRAPRAAGPLAPVNLVPDLRGMAEAPDMRDGLKQQVRDGSSVAPAGR